MIEAFKPSPEFREKMKVERGTYTRRLYQSLYDGIGPGGEAAFVSGVLKAR